MARLLMLAIAASIACVVADEDVNVVYNVDATGELATPHTPTSTSDGHVLSEHDQSAPPSLDMHALENRKRSKQSSKQASSGSRINNEDDDSACIIPPGRVIQFPADSKPRTMALVSKPHGVVVADEAIHQPPDTGSWLDWLLGRQPRPFPFAYVVNNQGELVKKMEFTDRHVLPFGLGEGPDGSIGVTFYQGPGVEQWRYDENYGLKWTFHEFSVKPALPTFDNHGQMWVPYTIADRLGEEGETIIALWAYKPDGGRWEVFPRRSLSNVKFPHTVHIDGTGRVYVAGLTSWLWNDGTYGLEFKPGVDAAGSHVKIDVYELVSDRSHPAFQTEQKARHCEQYKGDCSKDGVINPGVEMWRSQDFVSSVQLVRSYAFPHPFNTCLWPIFVLTGDGHAICSCYDSDTLQIVKLGVPAADAAVGGIGQPHSDPAADFAAAKRTNQYQGDRNPFGLHEAHGPAEPPGGILLFNDVTAADPGSASLEIVATVKQPYGISTIAGLQMDPSGEGFAILDKGRKRVYGAPWPWPGMQDADGGAAATGGGDADADATSARLLPRGKHFNVKIPR